MTRPLLCYGSITIKVKLHVFGISRLTKNHQYKIRLRKRVTQTLVFPKFSFVFLRNAIYNEKCTHSTFSMSNTRPVTQIKPDD